MFNSFLYVYQRVNGWIPQIIVKSSNQPTFFVASAASPRQVKQSPRAQRVPKPKNARCKVQAWIPTRWLSGGNSMRFNPGKIVDFMVIHGD